MIRTLFVAFCMLGSGLAPAAPKIAPARVGEDYGEVDQTKKLNAEIKAKRQEALTLMREFENFQRVETERTDQEMVTRWDNQWLTIGLLICRKNPTLGCHSSFTQSKPRDITTQAPVAMVRTIAGTPASDDNRPPWKPF